MAQLLSRTALFLACCFSVTTLFSQPVTGSHGNEDYKDPKSHEKFRKRRIAVAAWQINQLKEGALVVRLNANSLLISELKKRGQDDLAEKNRLEQAAININMMRAYKHQYRFSPVYFMYSNNSDTLLKGTRGGIFLDSNLNVDPSITMKENFYLLADNDFVYNSSIGFVPEDSARFVSERGNPSSAEFPIVVKNKYGHQLKAPFPYAPSKFVFTKNIPSEMIVIDGKPYEFSVASLNQVFRGNAGKTANVVNGKPMELSIPKVYTYEALSLIVEQFNTELNEFYRGSAKPAENSKNYEDSKKFFY